MRLALLSCEVFYREMCWAVSRSPHQVDATFLPKGLHDLGSEEMSKRMQDALDGIRKSDYDAVLLGYGLCNNGLAGVRAVDIPHVLPRAHDCITLFMGHRQRYLDYFDANPGTYFKTSGWMERGTAGEDFRQLTIQHNTGMDMTYEELVEKYGEDNAQFLYEELCNKMKNYGQYTFIEMGVEPKEQFEEEARKQAEEKGYTFEKIQGDISMIQRLVDGEWEGDEFLIVRPGRTIEASYELLQIVEAK